MEAEAGHLRAVGDDLGPLVDDEPGDGCPAAGGAPAVDWTTSESRPDTIGCCGVAGRPTQRSPGRCGSWATRRRSGCAPAVASPYISAVSSREAPSRTCAARCSQVTDGERVAALQRRAVGQRAHELGRRRRGDARQQPEAVAEHGGDARGVGRRRRGRGGAAVELGERGRRPAAAR